MKGSKGHQAMRIVRFMLEIQREKLAENKNLSTAEIIQKTYDALGESIITLRNSDLPNRSYWEDVLYRETVSFIRNEFGDEFAEFSSYCAI